MTAKKFQDLNLSNAFLFAAALSDNETCRLILEMVLDESIPEVTVHTEHNIMYSSDFRSIRLDVYATDFAQVEYNVEMQNTDEKNLAKRARFHQSQMDVTSLKPGEDFSCLNPAYVIFICTFDPYGDGLYRYTFENRCLELDKAFGDGTRKVILNTKGTNPEGVSELLVDFLHYVENTTDAYVKTIDKSSNVHKLHEKIKVLKKSRGWEERYMTFDEIMRRSEKAGEVRGYQEGHAQGRLEEREKMLKLLQLMAENGETDLIPYLSGKPELLEEMYQKYHLS